MTVHGALWVIGGYLAGTFPSTWVVSKATGARSVIAGSRRDAGETDAHIVMARGLGGGWAALAAIIDLGTGFAWPLAARHWGHEPAAWVAMAGVAVVVGHAFPFYARAMSGRGLAAASGVYLALLPLPMVVVGLTMCAGFVLRRSGLFSTVGFGSVPFVAWLQGQPPAFVAMGAAVFALIVIRRLEGTGRVVRETGLSWPRAALYRAAFDASGPPSPAVDRPATGELAP